MAHTRALLVGIENYANPANNLPGVSNDVSAFMRILGRYGITDVEVLRDANATSPNIRTALHRLVADARPDDVRIFYYSGHGALLPPGFAQSDDPDGRDEAFVPYEGTTDSLILDNWYAKFLKEKLPPRSTLYSVVDCCHSGELYKQGIAIKGLPPDLDGPMRKEIDFTTLEYTGNPFMIGRGGNGLISVKAFVSEDELGNSVHIAASQPGVTALVMSIGGQRRSVFTWALEEVLRPSMTVGELEPLLSAKQLEQTEHHKPYVATREANKARPVFS
ncbi:MAG: caspase family protein [Pseudomonadota bacterium]